MQNKKNKLKKQIVHLFEVLTTLPCSFLVVIHVRAAVHRSPGSAGLGFWRSNNGGCHETWDKSEAKGREAGGEWRLIGLHRPSGHALERPMLLCKCLTIHERRGKSCVVFKDLKNPEWRCHLRGKKIAKCNIYPCKVSSLDVRPASACVCFFCFFFKSGLHISRFTCAQIFMYLFIHFDGNPRNTAGPMFISRPAFEKWKMFNRSEIPLRVQTSWKVKEKLSPRWDFSHYWVMKRCVSWKTQKSEGWWNTEP